MKVLFLAHRFPFPPNKGDKIRSFNILRYLAARHEVHLGCLIDDPADLQAVPEFVKSVRSVAFDVIRPGPRKLLCVSALLRSQSLTLAYFYSRKLQRRVDEIIAAAGIEAVFCSSSPMAEYVFRSRHWGGRLKQVRRIMDLIDVDSLKWAQYADSSPAWKAWIYRYEARHLAAYERRIAGAFDRLYVVSESEMGHFPGGAADISIQAISNGVDLEYFTPGGADAVSRDGPSAADSGHEPTIVFTGVMDYWPNVEGVKWFVESVLPSVRAAVPAVRFVIVGSRPTPEVRRLESAQGVTVTGFVNDVREYVRQAAVCVAPLRIARGVQNKILEAMAMAKAMVTTPQGHEGLRARVGEEILVAQDAASFAASVVDLLVHSEKAQRIGSNARRCVERNYCWDDNLRALDEAMPVSGAVELARAGG